MCSAVPQKPSISRPDKPTLLHPKDYRPITMTVGDNLTALTDTSISIDCSASGIPTPTITWTLNDQELSPGSGYVIHENGTLVIEKASLLDEGRYRCIAKNVKGEDTKNSLVNVVGKLPSKIITNFYV